MNRRMMVLAMAFALAVPASRSEPTRRRSRRKCARRRRTRSPRSTRRQPSARKAVESAAGYAAFSNFGMKILVAGGGSGKGIAVNNKTKAMTYMKMAEIQAGLGFGAKKFQVVWVFETDAALNNFINSGWEFGAQATAAAKSGDKGAAYQGAVAVVAGGLDLPGHGQRPGARAHRQGHQVLQGQRPELRRASMATSLRRAGGPREASSRSARKSAVGVAYEFARQA